MNPLRVFLVDDEPPARARLRDLLADCAAEVPSAVMGEAANGLEALGGIEASRPDLVLVDVQMPGMSGLELARHLQRMTPAPAVVFTTAFDQYAVAAFEVNAIDYLLKPVRAGRLATALRKAADGTRVSAEALRRVDPQARRHLASSERGRIHLVPVGDILLLRAEQKYVTARASGRDFLIEESLVQLEQEFEQIFVRVHRNCLVARSRIRGAERLADENGEPRWSVLLQGLDEPVPVSRRQWPVLKSLVRG